MKVGEYCTSGSSPLDHARALMPCLCVGRSPSAIFRTGADRCTLKVGDRYLSLRRSKYTWPPCIPPGSSGFCFRAHLALAASIRTHYSRKAVLCIYC